VVKLPDEGSAERLASTLGVGRVPPEENGAAPSADGAPASGSASGRAKHLAKRALEPVASKVLPRIGRAVAPHVAMTGAMAEFDERLHHLDARMEALRAAWDVPTPPALAERLATNQELFKAELQGLRHALDEFGMAIAPGAGLDAAPARVAEMRARLDVIDKRVRSLLERSSPIPDPNLDDTVPVLPATFDYVGFERRFRGETDVVLGRTEERYFDLLAASAPVLDVGCGRGEVLARLEALGVSAIGVDLDAGMVAEAKAAGVDARQGDALAFLADADAASFGAVIAIQVVEHLSLDALLSLLELAYTKLRPGGTLVLETPNPASLIVLGNSYLLDPTHVRPLHPSLLSFLVERAGFADVRLEFFDPATGYHLDLIDETEVQEPWVATVNAAFRRLNEVLFGPQDYAVIARR
jgi:SAM-dependent methyltransferase